MGVGAQKAPTTPTEYSKVPKTEMVINTLLKSSNRNCGLGGAKKLCSARIISRKHEFSITLISPWRLQLYFACLQHA